VRGLLQLTGGLGVSGLALICANASVRHADFSPRARRESCSLPTASNENSNSGARLCGTTQKELGPARRRPSSVYQEVVVRAQPGSQSSRDTGNATLVSAQLGQCPSGWPVPEPGSGRS
jgi:hypothetical protein